MFSCFVCFLHQTNLSASVLTFDEDTDDNGLSLASPPGKEKKYIREVPNAELRGDNFSISGQNREFGLFC